MTLLAWPWFALRPIAALVILVAFGSGLPRWIGAVIGATLGIFLAGALATPQLAATLVALAHGDIVAALIVAVHEILVGTALGLFAVVPFAAIAWAGGWIAVSARTGATGLDRTAVQLLRLTTAAVFVGIDGPRWVASAIARSFSAMPIGESGGGLGDHLFTMLGGLASSALCLAIPFIVGAAIVELAFGVAQRASGRRFDSAMPWRGIAVIAAMAAGLVLIATGIADAIRAAL